ncbi:MAG: hypothetical protein SFW67_11040 [Myxococcaceae bacterium]|nr:hypothetical protein [Myxococcaceae bacterium]
MGPAQWGTIELTQRTRTSGSRTTFSTRVLASFLDVAAGTPNPCVERTEGACTVRVCNLDGAVRGIARRTGVLTLEGALLVDGPDGGPDGGRDAGGLDAGITLPMDDGGVLTLVPTDAGAFAAVNARLFTDGLAMIIRASGDEVPPFVSPPLLAPSQVTVRFPRCATTCPVVSRELPLRVEWADAPVGDVLIELVGRQVSARCRSRGLEERFELGPEVLREFPPTVEPGDATLIVSGVSSVSFDAGTWDVTLTASTPTFVPLTLE